MFITKEGITFVIALMLLVQLLPWSTMSWLAVSFFTMVVGIMFVIALISVLLLCSCTMSWLLAVTFFTTVLHIMILLILISALLLPGTMAVMSACGDLIHIIARQDAS